MAKVSVALLLGIGVAGFMLYTLLQWAIMSGFWQGSHVFLVGTSPSAARCARTGHPLDDG